MKCKNQKIGNMIYLLPLILGLFIFKFWPLIQVVIISFKEDFDYATKSYTKIGIGNYSIIFNDRYFIQSIENTVIYVCAVVVFTVIISFLISWCLLRIKRLTGFFVTLILLPLISSDIVIGICWRFMFNEKGIINAMLEKVGFLALPWLTDKNLSLFSLILYGIWTSLPMSSLLFYSSMQKIKSNLLISAKLDHSSDRRILIAIIVPMLKSTIVVVTVINIISSWLVFNGLFPLFSGLPGPYYNIYTLVYYIYTKAGEGNRALGIACAASVILLFLVAIFLIIRCFYYEKRNINTDN